MKLDWYNRIQLNFQIFYRLRFQLIVEYSVSHVFYYRKPKSSSLLFQKRIHLIINQKQTRDFLVVILS